MKIKIEADAVCGKITIPKGDYFVHFNSDTHFLILSRPGKDIKIPAKRRRLITKTRVTTIQFHSGGGTTWTIAVSTPKYGEWVAFVEYSSTMLANARKAAGHGGGSGQEGTGGEDGGMTPSWDSDR